MTTIAVCAMGKQPFDGIAASWIDHLDARGFDVNDHRARRVRRDAVVDDLHGAADTVVYIGHGRSRGWSGYQTLRMHHLETADARCRVPVDAVLAFACHTAGRDAEGRCFGEWLVRTRRCRAYLGWACDIPIETGTGLADRFIRTIAERGPRSIGELLELVDDQHLPVHQRDLLSRAILHGDPDAGLVRRLDHRTAQPV